MNSSVTYSGPAGSEAVARLSAAVPQLPAAYLAFLSQFNGAEGSLGAEPGWFVVWSAEEALVASNEYGVSEYLPGYFAFGSNGGGELLVFHLAKPTEGQVFMVPAVGMAEPELLSVAGSFAEFTAQMGKVIP
jgi:hypothetical protein